MSFSRKRSSSSSSRANSRRTCAGRCPARSQTSWTSSAWPSMSSASWMTRTWYSLMAILVVGSRHSSLHWYLDRKHWHWKPSRLKTRCRSKMDRLRRSSRRSVSSTRRFNVRSSRSDTQATAPRPSSHTSWRMMRLASSTLISPVYVTPMAT